MDCGQQKHSETSGVVIEPAACGGALSKEIKQNEGVKTCTSAAVVNDLQQSNSETIVETIVSQNIEKQSDEHQVTQDTSQSPTANSSSISVNNTEEEEHQNEQDSENAGIDLLSPLALVNKVSIPSSDNLETQKISEKIENAGAMEKEHEAETEVEEIIINQGCTVEDIYSAMNAYFSLKGKDDSDQDIETWSEDDLL